MKFLKLLIILIYLMSSRQVFANEITTNATSQIDLTNNGSGEGDPDLTVKEGITVIKDNQNNLVKGYDSDGISTATIIVETGAKIQGKNNTIMLRQADDVTITNSGSNQTSASISLLIRGFFFNCNFWI